MPELWPATSLFPANGRIAVGFGYAALRDGEPVTEQDWSDDDEPEPNDRSDEAEEMAAADPDPDHDWRIVLYGPLSGRTYQRHRTGHMGS